MDLDLESMLMRGVGVRQIRRGDKLKNEPLLYARGGELQSGLIPPRAIVGGDQVVAVPMINVSASRPELRTHASSRTVSAAINR